MGQVGGFRIAHLCADPLHRPVEILPPVVIICLRGGTVVNRFSLAVHPVGGSVVRIDACFPAHQEVRVIAVAFTSVHGIILGAVNVIPGCIPIAHLDHVPSMVICIAGHIFAGQSGQIAEILEGLCVAVAHGAPLHQGVVGVCLAVRLVILAVGDQIVVEVQELFNIRALGDPGDDGGTDIVERGDVAACISGIVKRCNRSEPACRIAEGLQPFDIKELIVGVQHFVIQAVAFLNGEPVRTNVDLIGTVFQSRHDLAGDGFSGRFADLVGLRPDQTAQAGQLPPGRIQDPSAASFRRCRRLRGKNGARQHGEHERQGQQKREHSFFHGKSSYSQYAMDRSFPAPPAVGIRLSPVREAHPRCPSRGYPRCGGWQNRLHRDWRHEPWRRKRPGPPAVP